MRFLPYILDSSLRKNLKTSKCQILNYLERRLTALYAFKFFISSFAVAVTGTVFWGECDGQTERRKPMGRAEGEGQTRSRVRNVPVITRSCRRFQILGSQQINQNHSTFFATVWQGGKVWETFWVGVRTRIRFENCSSLISLLGSKERVQSWWGGGVSGDQSQTE